MAGTFNSIGGPVSPQLSPADMARYQREAVRRLVLVLDAAGVVSWAGTSASQEEWDRLRGALSAAPLRMAQILLASLPVIDREAGGEFVEWLDELSSKGKVRDRSV